jgi:hypothetical protein
MTPGDDDEQDDARTLVRWTERRGRPLSHPHRHTVARHDRLAEGSSDVPAVNAFALDVPALATTRIERIEQAALLVHCRQPVAAAPADAAPVEPALDQATVPLVVPIDTPVTAPVAAPALQTAASRPVAGQPARRRGWRALAVVIVIAVSGAAGYEVAVHAGDAILSLLR